MLVLVSVSTAAKFGSMCSFNQGTAVNLRLVARGEVDTQTHLKPGMGPALAAASGANQSAVAAVETDAARAAQVVADRVAGYYKQQVGSNRSTIRKFPVHCSRAGLKPEAKVSRRN